MPPTGAMIGEPRSVPLDGVTGQPGRRLPLPSHAYTLAGAPPGTRSLIWTISRLPSVRLSRSPRAGELKVCDWGNRGRPKRSAPLAEKTLTERPTVRFTGWGEECPEP